MYTTGRPEENKGISEHEQQSKEKMQWDLLFTSHKKEAATQIKNVDDTEERKREEKAEERGKEMKTSRCDSTKGKW